MIKFLRTLSPWGYIARVYEFLCLSVSQNLDTYKPTALLQRYEATKNLLIIFFTRPALYLFLEAIVATHT